MKKARKFDWKFQVLFEIETLCKLNYVPFGKEIPFMDEQRPEMKSKTAKKFCVKILHRKKRETAWHSNLSGVQYYSRFFRVPIKYPDGEGTSSGM